MFLHHGTCRLEQQSTWCTHLQPIGQSLVLADRLLNVVAPVESQPHKGTLQKGGADHLQVRFAHVLVIICSNDFSPAQLKVASIRAIANTLRPVAIQAAMKCCAAIIGRPE